jgi:hypothetical protein
LSEGTETESNENASPMKPPRAETLKVKEIYGPETSFNENEDQREPLTTKIIYYPMLGSQQYKKAKREFFRFLFSYTNHFDERRRDEERSQKGGKIYLCTRLGSQLKQMGLQNLLKLS